MLARPNKLSPNFESPPFQMVGVSQLFLLLLQPVQLNTQIAYSLFKLKIFLARLKVLIFDVLQFFLDLRELSCEPAVFLAQHLVSELVLVQPSQKILPLHASSLQFFL